MKFVRAVDMEREGKESAVVIRFERKK